MSRNGKSKGGFTPKVYPPSMGKRPDYKVWAAVKDGIGSGTVGAAWINGNDEITIKLNAFVTLTAGTTIRLYKVQTDDTLTGIEVEYEEQTGPF